MGAIEELILLARRERAYWCGEPASVSPRAWEDAITAVEAELAARGEERVVEVTPQPGGRTDLHLRTDRYLVPDSVTNRTARLIFGDVPDGTHRFAIRRLHDDPEPCSACNGTGTVYLPQFRKVGDGMETRCFKCGGTGKGKQRLPDPPKPVAVRPWRIYEAETDGRREPRKVCGNCRALLTTTWEHVCVYCGTLSDFDNPCDLPEAVAVNANTDGKETDR